MIDRRNVQDIYPLTPMQEGMLFQAQIDPESSAYFQQMKLELQGDLDPSILERAWNSLLSRHDALRTAFVQGNAPQPMQVVFRERPLYMTQENLSTVSSDQARIKIDEYCLQDRTHLFQLARDNLIRIHLFRKTEQRWTMVLSFHHIIMDGWCFPVIFRELYELYSSLKDMRASNLPPTQPFSRYVQWLEKQKKSESLKWWREELSGLETPSRFPETDVFYERGKRFLMGRHTFDLSEELSDGLRAYTSSNGVTLSTLVRALWALLLRGHGAGDDVVFGVTVSGRPAELPGVERMVGLFINTLPCRVRINAAEPFTALVTELQEQSLELDQRFSLPLAEIQTASNLKRDLIQQLLIFENLPGESEGKNTEFVPGVEALSSVTFEQTQYDLEVTFFPRKRMEIRFTFNASRYGREEMVRIGERFQFLVSSLLRNSTAKISDFDILPETERQLILERFNNPDVCDAITRSLPELFAEQVTHCGDDSAILFQRKRLTFKELDVSSNCIARRLSETNDIQPDERIGLILRRSEKLPICMLGIWKLGAAYVPIDPDYPLERIAIILERASVKRVIVDDPAYWLEVLDELHLNWIGVDEALKWDSTPISSLASDPNRLAYVTFTSGSTGEPKGVMVTQANVVSFIQNLTDRFGIKAGDTLYAVTTYTFDISVLELLCSLLSGVTVVIGSRETTSEPARILEELADRNITVLQMTPSHLSMIVEGLFMLPDLRVLLVGGEVMPDELHDILSNLPAMQVFNVYGPTETTIWSTAKQISANERTIGAPLIGERVFILGSDRQLLPIGVSGEICIGGSGVTQGYIGREDLTRESFIVDPTQSGDKLYRTGDRGRWLPNGEIEFQGRLDNQLKVRGFRVEPGEIEAHIARIDGVQETAVVALQDDDSSVSLVAFYTGFERLDDAILRNELTSHLPAYLIPTRFQQIERMPLTSSGKIDRNALALYSEAPSASAKVIEQPRTELEWKIARVWMDVLHLQQVGVCDSFLDLGGHSLKAMQIVARMHKEIGVSVTVGDLFGAGTIEALAMKVRSIDHVAFQTIPHLTGIAPSALSHAQRRLWVLEKIGGTDSSAYILPGALHLRGDLDKTALEQAFRALIERHEALRTRFIEVTGEPHQEVVEQVDFFLPEEDFRGYSEPESEAIEWITGELVRPFDLMLAPLMEARLFRLAEQEWVLFTRIHHIIADADSMNILERELVEYYSALCEKRAPSLSELKVRYRDFAAWQARLLDEERSRKDLDYWLNTLRGFTPLDLPLDNTRPATQNSRGETFVFELDTGSVKALVDLGRSRQVSLFTTLLALMNLFFKRITGEKDILLGTPVSGREHPDLEPVVGFFANTLPLRTQVEDSLTFLELLDSTGRVVRSAMDHALYPFDYLVDRLNLPRDLSRPPLLSVLLSLEEGDERASLPGLTSRRLPLTAAVSRFDLTLEAVHSEGRLRLGFNYATALFERRTMERWAKWLVNLTQAVLEEPNVSLSKLEMLSAEEKRFLLFDLQGIQRQISPEENLVVLFDQTVRQYPEQIAVQDERHSITYNQLDKTANRLANTILELGIKRGEIVASLHDRSYDAIVAMLGILKSGAAYLPLKLDNPLDRTREILSETGCRLLINTDEHHTLTQEFGLERSLTPCNWENHSSQSPGIELTGCDLAYIIYTSGSTGKPKGVLVEHGGFCNMIQDQIKTFGINYTDRILQFAPLTFDASLSEVFMALLTGATLIPVQGEKVEDRDLFRHFLQERGITVATLPPSYLALLDSETLQELRILITAGEVPRLQDLEKHRRYLRCFNAYGPTEASVCVTIQEVNPDFSLDQNVPLGKPITNMRFYLLDGELKPVGVGIPGEVYLGGVGLARGYLNRPDENRQRFLADPFKPGERLYRTGDRAVRDDLGAVRYIDRIDEQVKLRGQRIELGEIRSRLLSMPEVNDAVLVPYPSNGYPVGITAYITGSDTLDMAEMRLSLRSHLPESMIPSRFAKVTAIPLTPNGKVDFTRLQELEKTPVSDKPTESLSPMHEWLLSLWRELPGMECIGMRDSFFESGGNSLSAIQLVSKISNLLGRKVGVRELFLNPTVESFAISLESNADTHPAITPCVPRANLERIAPAVHLEERSLLEQFESGELGTVDAAAIGYFTEELLEATGLNRREFLQKAGNEPILSNIIVSPRGRIAFFTLPLFTGNLYSEKPTLLKLLSKTMTLAGDMGVRVVSLTGLIPSATRYGIDLEELAVQNQSWPKVTTGHATTAATVLLTIERILSETGRTMENETLGMLGLGSVGTSMLRLVLAALPHPQKIVLCDLVSQRQHLEKLKSEVRQKYRYFNEIANISLNKEGNDLFYNCSLIIGATNIADILEVHRLHPGTLVVDDSGPHCFSEQLAIKRMNTSGDVIFTEGGVLRQSEPFYVRTFLPTFLREWMHKKGIQPYSDFNPNEITGCVISSLLTAIEVEILPTLGPPDVESCLAHNKALHEWGLTATDLRIGDTRITPKQIEDFRIRFNTKDHRIEK